MREKKARGEEIGTGRGERHGRGERGKGERREAQ